MTSRMNHPNAAERQVPTVGKNTLTPLGLHVYKELHPQRSELRDLTKITAHHDR